MTFEVMLGKFLRFMVQRRVIKANFDKIKAMLDMKSVKRVKVIQSYKLFSKLQCLSFFISKAIDHCKLFFKALKSAIKLQWTPKYKGTFQQLKEYLVNSLLLAKLKSGDSLLMYLAILKNATSSILVREEVDGAQRLVYFTSKVMVNAKKRYHQSEKLILPLVISYKKTILYF